MKTKITNSISLIHPGTPLPCVFCANTLSSFEKVFWHYATCQESWLFTYAPINPLYSCWPTKFIYPITVALSGSKFRSSFLPFWHYTTNTMEGNVILLWMPNSTWKRRKWAWINWVTSIYSTCLCFDWDFHQILSVTFCSRFLLAKLSEHCAGLFFKATASIPTTTTAHSFLFITPVKPGVFKSIPTTQGLNPHRSKPLQSVEAILIHLYHESNECVNAIHFFCPFLYSLHIIWCNIHWAAILSRLFHTL